MRYDRHLGPQLRQTDEALVGFALARGRLPCPDTDRDGIENPPGGALPPAEGNGTRYLKIPVDAI